MPTRPRFEGGVDLERVGGLELDRAPAAELGGEVVEALVVGLDQLQRLLAGERLDPERGRERDQRPVHPVLGQRRGAAGDVGGVEGEDAVGLGGDAEGPPLAAADQHRRLGAPRERLDQRLAEQVLVDVDGGGTDSVVDARPAARRSRFPATAATGAPRHRSRGAHLSPA